jgi:hypothetical protein
MWTKDSPSEHEKKLFDRAQKYIQKISWIPGIEMIAIVNSLSMFTTHRDSDIDLFIVTKPKMLWFVRFFVTITLYRLWVWRHGRDIAGNFCLSFFVTTDAMNMENIAIDNDIYFYYWIYYMKPVLVRWDIYERFLEQNSWVKIDTIEMEKNKAFCAITTSTENNTYLLSIIYYLLSACIRFFFLPKTLRNYQKLWKPEGVIITDDILKFHDQDRRRELRNKIFQKNFDK